MADFTTSLKFLLLDEGKYAGNRLDKGGETYCGISRNNHPEWTGWKIIDDMRSQADFPRSLDANPGLQSLVADFYHKTFWLFDDVKDQGVANKLLDIMVNLGAAGATTLLQRALQSAGWACPIDGKFGPATLEFTNRTEPVGLLKELQARQALYYAEILMRSPDQVTFALGWFRRSVK